MQEKQTAISFLFHKQVLWMFFGINILYIFLSYLTNSYILTDYVYHRGLSEHMTAEKITSFLEMRSQYQWLNLIAPFIVISAKAGYSAICLAVGVIITGQDISFAKLFRIAFLAESVFVVAMAVQVLGAMYLIEVRVPDDYANFAPLSALQFFDVSTLKLWMKHPLRTLNLFEVVYVFVLAYFLTPLLKKGTTFWQTLGLVGASYGLGLLLWVVALAFLLLQVS